LCDDCNSKLQQSHTFREQCISVFHKSNPDFKIAPIEEPPPSLQTSENYFIGEEVNSSSLVVEPESHFVTTTGEINEDFSEDGNAQSEDFDEVYFELVESPSSSTDDDRNIKTRAKRAKATIKQINLKSEETIKLRQSYTVDEKLEIIHFAENSNNRSAARKYGINESSVRCFRKHKDSLVQEDSSESKDTMKRRSYTVQTKLQIIQFAEDHNNREAARKYGINESSVRCFRRHKEVLLKMNPNKMTNRGALPHWPELESELKKWVEMREIETGSKVSFNNIKASAKNIASKQGIADFNGSNSYIFKFMQRNQIPSASPRRRNIKKEEDNS